VQFVKKLVLWSLVGVAFSLVGCGSIDLSKMAIQLPTPSTPAPQVSTSPMATPSVSPPIAYAPDITSYRQQVGRKIIQTNGTIAFSGKLPDPLASIPVIEISLNADGSILGLDVRRAPRFHPETAQMAMDAIRKAAPFGPISNLPQPWIFNETFLFNDDLKFQVLSLQP
jgi:hypothetical protein